jgi:hypothetical protein
MQMPMKKCVPADLYINISINEKNIITDQLPEMV